MENKKAIYQEKADKILELINGFSYDEIIKITIIVRDIARTKAILDNDLEPVE